MAPLGSGPWLDDLEQRLSGVATDPEVTVAVRQEVDASHWTIVVAGGRATLDRNGVRPDVTLATDGTTAEAIAAGRLSVQDALGDRRLRVAGDLRKLVAAAPAIGAALGSLGP